MICFLATINMNRKKSGTGRITVSCLQPVSRWRDVVIVSGDMWEICDCSCCSGQALWDRLAEQLKRFRFCVDGNCAEDIFNEVIARMLWK